MTLNEEILKYIDAHRQEAYELLLEFARIPARSHHEERRAEFCKNWLQQQGAELTARLSHSLLQGKEVDLG